MTMVLVTGGEGFIGSCTIDRLVADGYHVRSLDNREWQVHRGRRPKYLRKGVEYLRGDVRNPVHWRRALRSVDQVIHLAGAVGIAQSFWQVRKYVSVNSVGTATLFELLTRDRALRRSVQKVVVASSKALYGEGSYACSSHGVFFPEVRPVEQLKRKDWEIHCPHCDRPTHPVAIREDKPPQNLSPYALSKYDQERLAVDYSYALGLPVVGFRYFNVYGPRQSLSNPYTGVLAIFLSRLRNSNPPVLFEDGQQMRDFVFVEDVARLNVRALSKGNGVYNLGSGTPTSLLDVLRISQKALGTQIEPRVTQEFRAGDTRHDFADMMKCRKDFGHLALTPLPKGIERLVRWAGDAVAEDHFDRQERERGAHLGPSS